MKTTELIREILDMEELHQELIERNKNLIYEVGRLKDELDELRSEYNKLAMSTATDQNKAQLVK